MSLPQNAPRADSYSSAIAGTVFPTGRAEELLMSLPGVVAARIVASEHGAVNEIHVLTTQDLSPKQTVRNVESALIAQLGIRVDHRKISVATTNEPQPAAEPRLHQTAAPAKAEPSRAIYFEDVEVRRSRAKGVTCRVTLRKDDQSYIGEAEGPESVRSRVELAARAALVAIAKAEGDATGLVLEGCRLIEAFEREFAFVGVRARFGRESAILTGSCEVKDSAETASVLAALDATNRWMGRAGR